MRAQHRSQRTISGLDGAAVRTLLERIGAPLDTLGIIFVASPRMSGSKRSEGRDGACFGPELRGQELGRALDASRDLVGRRMRRASLSRRYAAMFPT